MTSRVSHWSNICPRGLLGEIFLISFLFSFLDLSPLLILSHASSFFVRITVSTKSNLTIDNLITGLFTTILRCPYLNRKLQTGNTTLTGNTTFNALLGPKRKSTAKTDLTLFPCYHSSTLLLSHLLAALSSVHSLAHMPLTSRIETNQN